jgi:hypothetical protein
MVSIEGFEGENGHDNPDVNQVVKDCDRNVLSVTFLKKMKEELHELKKK